MDLIQPYESHFEHVRHLIKEMQLDDRELRVNEFIVAVKDDLVLGFGRVRKYGSCSELCSLGVVEEHRDMGIGRGIVDALVKRTEGPLYVVCIIPRFFERCGFRVTNEFPESIAQKKSFCETALGGQTEGSPYVVMKYAYSEAEGRTDT